MTATNSLRTFAAIAYNELLFNSKRVAPYAMASLCAGCGVLWWGWGPAIGRAVAINSDFFIAGVMPPYSFLFLPLFTALFMADPVSRDFRLGVHPLVFSKPISRAEYLLGKFFGTFFVLACCQSAMVVTWFVLQPVPKKGLVTLPGITVIPYIKHFLMLVVISHLGLAAFYFAVGVLTRSAKIVYGLGVAFYPVYFTYHGVLLDLIINRLVMILLAAICLTIVYKRFPSTKRSENVENFSLLHLSTAAERVYYQNSSQATCLDEFETRDCQAGALSIHVAVPKVVRVNDRIRANVDKLIAALGVEFRLLAAERSLVVLMPLAIFLSILEVAFYNREVKIESVIWSTPVPNSVLILSKYLATVVLALSLVVIVGLIATLIQLMRGHMPVDFFAYLMVYGVVLVPGIIFLTAVAVASNVLLRNKYVAYVAAIGTGSGLFYLYSVGYNYWLYNPLLYQLWTYADLTSPAILASRVYCLGLAAVCLVLSHIFFERKPSFSS